MNITSIVFFGFVTIIALLYYLFPLKYRWIVVLGANLYFLYSSNSWILNAIWLFGALLTFGAAKFIGNNLETKPERAKAILISVIVILVGFMLATKDIGFFTEIIDKIGKRTGLGRCATPDWKAPLGVSYYTLIWIGYLLDVYWMKCKEERNPLKFLAFCGYFPILISGPIVRYDEVRDSIVLGNKFDYKNLSFGVQRILWGLMKKMIIAERLAIVVNKIYDDTYKYPGAYVWVAMILFVFQIYADFSGCIDIVLGVAEILGIRLPENFDLPFMAGTVAEFWRRWHMTLGSWLKDYIFFPVQRTKWMQKVGEKAKKAFGKKTGRKIPVWFSLLITWFLIGFWHGGQWNNIVGVGLYFGILIILSEMLSPFFGKITRALKINTDSFSFRLFQRIRTFFLFMIGESFFRAYDGVESALVNWKNALTVYNPWVLADGSMRNLGLDQHDIYILLFFGLVLAVSGIIKYYTKTSIRELVAKQGLVFRWILYLVLIYSVIIYGCYGINFDSAAFIYQKF